MSADPASSVARRFGDSALVVGTSSPEAAARAAAAVAGASLRGVVDVVAGLRTVVVVCDPTRAHPAEVAGRLGALDLAPPPAAAGRAHAVPTVFDGPDLAEVARLVGTRPAAVVEALAGTPLRVAVFGLLARVRLPGRPAGAPRGARPAGHAPGRSSPPGRWPWPAGFAAVYPQATPGGWHLVGRTVLDLFDPSAPPYSRFQPGDTVRFTPVAAGPGPDPAPAGPARPAWSAGPGARWPSAVEDPGLLSLVQDRGRLGMAHLGVPAAGPADPRPTSWPTAWSATTRAAAALEITARGPRLLAGTELHVAVVGGRRRDDPRRPGGRRRRGGPGAPRPAPGRRPGPATGCGPTWRWRAACDVPEVMGSRSTDTLSWVGPGPLRRGRPAGPGRTPGPDRPGRPPGPGGARRGGAPDPAGGGRPAPRLVRRRRPRAPGRRGVRGG